MIRKFLCYVILVTMTVHCSSRLGILSYLFEKRHAIAYSIGMIAEKPIALCHAEYDFSDDLKIQDSDSSQRVPQVVTAHEINLFLVSIFEVDQSFSPWSQEKPGSFYSDLGYRSPVLTIFHPPA